jgi:hypothetical protein
MDPSVLVVERSTPLARSADEVWERVTTPAGINHELGPWMRMTIPRGWAGASLADVVPPVRLGRSWVLLFGVIPFDYDDLAIDALGERSFRERSTMLSAREWQHERWVVPDELSPGDRCVVRDRLEFVPRRAITAIPRAARIHRAVIAAVFAHRHRRLRRWCSARRLHPDVSALIDTMGRWLPARRRGQTEVGAPTSSGVGVGVGIGHVA